MQVKTFGCALECMLATTITIELSLDKGNHRVISGLPDDSVKESLARIEAAIVNSGFCMPEAKIVYNLHPAAIRKTGTGLDLPMALAMLAASNQILSKKKLHDFLIYGELSLSGEVQGIPGCLSIALHGWKEKFKGVIVPLANVEEASMVTKVPVFGVNSLNEAVAFINGQVKLEPVVFNTREMFYNNLYQFDIDFSDVKGQQYIKRGLEVCAAGSHNAIMIGPPGAGKSMAASRLPTILPPMTLQEALEVTQIQSICGETEKLKSGLVAHRKFISTHYSTSIPGLIGGGSQTIMPGLITHAHNGVLFLDELAEYSRAAIESIRLPLETGEVKITRAMRTVSFPANFMLIAATNPCPCGYFNHPDKNCSCSPRAIQKYLSKISGPLMDRIHIHLEVFPTPAIDLTQDTIEESSATIRERVIKAREIQNTRFKGNDTIHHNAQMTSALIKKHCALEADAAELLISALNHLNLSGRAHDRILQVARTIADLEGSEIIRFAHLSEAVGYRSLDKEKWMTGTATGKGKSSNKKTVFKIA